MNNLSRRGFVKLFSGVPIALASVLESSRSAPAKPAGAGPSAEQWMSAWMGVNKGVSGALKLSRFKDPIYFLLDSITWTATPLQPGLPASVTVPKGFVTDLASIPRIFWSALRPDGEYAYAAIVHDYLYWRQEISRPKSDLILKLAMQDFQIASATIATIYNAVRVGGAGAWSSNTRERSHGEKRILKLFPEDPRITWAQWKQQADVFE